MAPRGKARQEPPGEELLGQAPESLESRAWTEGGDLGRRCRALLLPAAGASSTETQSKGKTDCDRFRLNFGLNRSG